MAPKLASNDDAVSPIVGTILMVAIGVVLAGGLFFVVAGLGSKNKGTPPDMRFIRDESADTLQVVKINPAVDRNQFEIRMSVIGDFEADGPVSAGAFAAPVANTWVPVADAPGGPGAGLIEAGSSFSFCA
ncbi:MAG: Archaeal Type pilin, N-terminal, partial [Thermoplasmata archaeon]|nr:Archaeal Type pilin, N-terminal [Thermoplasmata archaeon]